MSAEAAAWRSVPAIAIEIAAGHLLQMSHPDEVTALIEEAAKSVD